MHRRTFIAGSGVATIAGPGVAAIARGAAATIAAGEATLARPAIAAGTRPLVFVPQANLTSLDPVWTTATVTRNFAYMVYDMLYGRDEAFVPRPQMVGNHLIEDDGKRWTMKLRDGMLWHDGTPVLARDCVASLQRWMKRDAVGVTINMRVDAIEATDDRTLTWRLNDNKYTINTESRVAMLGKLTENRSEGTVDSFGLAPNTFYEKRFRKAPETATFDREGKTITFTDGKHSYPIKGGEQDRVSISWQLMAVARAAKDKFKPGSDWEFFVVGPRNADPWTFQLPGPTQARLDHAVPHLGWAFIALSDPQVRQLVIGVPARR